VLAPEKEFGAEHQVPAVGTRTTEQDTLRGTWISSIRKEIQLNRYNSYIETASCLFLNESTCRAIRIRTCSGSEALQRSLRRFRALVYNNSEHYWEKAKMVYQLLAIQPRKAPQAE
jgi:hypothetical protein